MQSREFGRDAFSVEIIPISSAFQQEALNALLNAGKLHNFTHFLHTAIIVLRAVKEVLIVRKPVRKLVKSTKNELLMAHILSLVVKSTGNGLLMAHITSLVVNFSAARTKNELLMAHIISLIVNSSAARTKNELLMARINFLGGETQPETSC